MSSTERHTMTRQSSSCLLLIVMVWMVGQVVDSWAPSADGSRRLYHCCCSGCAGKSRGAGRAGCFTCRNQEYYCNCDQCSCFPSGNRIEKEDPSSKYPAASCRSLAGVLSWISTSQKIPSVMFLTFHHNFLCLLRWS